MRALRLILSLLLLASTAAAVPAAADSMRYLSFDAASESARWRTGDVTVAIRKKFLTQRVDVLFRRKGSDLPLLEPDAPFDVAALRTILGDHDPEDVRLYSIDPQKGAKFMPIACEGVAQKAWMVISNPRPYRPLTIWVVRWDEQARAPALCVAMDYRFRGEWKMPPAANRAVEESPYYRGAN